MCVLTRWSHLWDIFRGVCVCVYLGSLTLDICANDLTKVFTLSVSNFEFLLSDLSATITIGNGTSTVGRATNDFRVVKEMGVGKTKRNIDHTVVNKVGNGG